jgi:hypothetical protein
VTRCSTLLAHPLGPARAIGTAIVWADDDVDRPERGSGMSEALERPILSVSILFRPSPIIEGHSAAAVFAIFAPAMPQDTDSPA